MYFTHLTRYYIQCVRYRPIEWNALKNSHFFKVFVLFLSLSSLLSPTLSLTPNSSCHCPKKNYHFITNQNVTTSKLTIMDKKNQFFLNKYAGFSSNIINPVWYDSHIYPFHHSIHNCRLATSSTSSTESSPNRLVIQGGGGGGSSSRSEIDAYDDPYVNANASTSGLSTQLSAAAAAATAIASGSATAVALPQCDVLPSTSLLQPISHSVRDLLEPDKSKRLKLDRKFDIDDTCSNDAFVFNASLRENPLKNNPKTATVHSNASK